MRLVPLPPWRPTVALLWGVAVLGLFNPCDYATYGLRDVYFSFFVTCGNATLMAPAASGLLVTWFAQLWSGGERIQSLYIAAAATLLVTVPHWLAAASMGELFNLRLILYSSAAEMLGALVGVTTGLLVWRSRGSRAQVALLALGCVVALSLSHVGEEATYTILVTIASLFVFFSLGRTEWRNRRAANVHDGSGPDLSRWR